MTHGSKRNIFPRWKDFPHWRLVMGSLGGFMLFAATWTWLVGRIAAWLP